MRIGVVSGYRDGETGSRGYKIPTAWEVDYDLCGL